MRKRPQGKCTPPESGLCSVALRSPITELTNLLLMREPVDTVKVHNIVVLARYV